MSRKINLSIAKINKVNKFKTGIDRYSNSLFHQIKKFKHIKTNIDIIDKNHVLFLSKFFKKNKNLGVETNDSIIHAMSPMNLNNYNLKGRLVTTIHDLCPLIVPYVYPFYVPYIFKITIKSLVKNNSYFIVNSNCTKNDLIKFFNIEESKIFITPLGVSKKFGLKNPETIKSVLNKYNICDEYFLFTGAMNKRKNLNRVIKAFVSFKSKVNNKIKLVLAGRMNWGGSELEKIVQKNNLTNDVIFPGYISEDDLPYVVSGAFANIYVSLYEGFGLPCLEAMKSGSPLIASNVSSIPEVTDDSAFLVDPENINSIANALIELYKNKSLRDKLISSGLSRAKDFSWENTAKKTLEAYYKILNY